MRFNQLKAVSGWRVYSLIFIGVYLNVAGCSVIYDVADECSRNSDCVTSAKKNMVCDEHLCVTSGKDDNNEDSNADDTNVDSGEPSSSDTGPQTDDTDDTATPGTSVLTGLDLLAGPCSRIDGLEDAGEIIPDDVIIIGSILPLTGELEVAGKHFDQVTLLALEEINRAGGILGRPLIKVSCDSGTSATTANQAAIHLREIGVQAVLGPFSSEIVLSVFNEAFRDAGILMVSAGANAPIISTVSQEGLIWSTSLPAAREARVIAEYLDESAWDKVAVIHRADTWGDSMFNAFYSKYCASSDVDCTNEKALLVRSYDTSDLATSLSSVVAELAAWQPDIVVHFTYVEDALTFITIAGTSGAPLNHILWNSTASSELIFPMLNASLHPALCNAEAVIQQMPSGIIYSSFLTRYRARFEGSDPVPYVASFYDAAYMLAYAIAASSSDQNPNPTGKEIAAAMRRLSSGTQVRVGAEDWNVGVMALQSASKATIDFVGASGDVNFQEEGTGSIVCPVEAVRYNVGAQTIESIGTIYSNDNVFTAPSYSGISDSVCTNIQ